MSEAINPTRWTYAVYGPKTFGLGEVGEGAFFQIRCMYGDVKMKENIEAMEFIRDASRVRHETGLTPRQLLEQRDALAEKLATCVEALEHFQNILHVRVNPGTLENARAALDLIKGEPK